jgi:hypothetical protein
MEPSKNGSSSQIPPLVTKVLNMNIVALIFTQTTLEQVKKFRLRRLEPKRGTS